MEPISWEKNYLVLLTYFKMMFPSLKLTCEAGSTWASAIISPPEASSLAKIIPTAPTREASTPFSTLLFSPRRHTNIFPFALCGSRVPLMHKRLHKMK